MSVGAELCTRIQSEEREMLDELYDLGFPGRFTPGENSRRRGQGVIVGRAIRLLYQVEMARAAVEAQAVQDAAGVPRERTRV